MHNAIAIFNKNLADVKQLSGLYQFLTTLTAPVSYDDILRSQLVYTVSAFDKLIHDLIRIGMVDIYLGNRLPTAKYQNEPIQLMLHHRLAQSSQTSIPPLSVFFNQILVEKFKTQSFQDPAKVADGLSYIWDEQQKWSKIAASMQLNLNDQQTRTQLKLFISRRNSIVHEADLDTTTNSKLDILPQDIDNAISFFEKCGNSIFDLVK